MNKFLFSMFAAVSWLVALAEPCVLEKGYKPQAKQSVDEVASLLGELSLETPAEQQAAEAQAVTPEPQAAETAAGKMPAPPVTADPPVTAVPSVTPADSPVTETVTGKAGILPATMQEDAPVNETVTGKAGILPATVPADTSVTNAESQVEETLPKKPKEKKLTGRPAKITSDTTVYNRKEGIASFEGHVHVDDEQYQMHADRVFLFFDVDKDSNSTNVVRRAKATNDVSRAAGDVRRVVAIGNVAMTNDAHRAYGAKATYSKKNGLVVLYSGDGITAEVRDESKAQPQIVRGKRIRFWIDSEQVEVDEADLTGAGPSGGVGTLKKALGK
jgi:lipopolysaccharide export system protein LptA